MTKIEPGSLVRIGQEAVIGADALQMILYRTKRHDYPLDWQPTMAKLRPLAFCRTKAGLLREITERGLIRTATGREIVETRTRESRQRGYQGAWRGHRGASRVKDWKMGDMASLPELTDEKLREMTERRQKSDLESARDAVFDLEAQLASAKSAHNRTFRPGLTDAKAMASAMALERIGNDLTWAKRHLADNAARVIELRRAQAEAPGVSRTFQIEAPDGRKGTVQATDLATAQKMLQPGYTVSGVVYPHYTAPVDAAAGNLLESLLKAHGDALISFLGADRPKLRKGNRQRRDGAGKPVMEVKTMTTSRELFFKISTEAGAVAFAKLVSARKIESPLSKAEWIELITAQAEANFTDPALSKQQKFTKYLETDTGKELFWASKVAPEEGAASALDRQEAFITKAAGIHSTECVAYQKARAEMDGPASAKMHSLAVDRMRETGHTYERAYSHVYGHENNQGLREQVKGEHMQATLAGVGYADSYRNPHPGGSGPRP